MLLLISALWPLTSGLTAQVSILSTNGFQVAINATNSVQILPARPGRLSLIVRDAVSGGARFYIEYGQAATTNSLPIEPGECYSEGYPIIDARSVNVLGTTNRTVWVQEKVE